MEDYQNRVVEERSELSKKIEKLSDFIGGPVYIILPSAEQILLERQLGLMISYSKVLGKRIELWGVKEEKE